MQLIVNRFYETKDHTIGRLAEEGGKFLCFTLEDPYNEPKIPGQTRIPDGTYPLTLRREGGKYAQYVARFGDWQRPGMLWVRDVPGFEWILIHPGNLPKDTQGCLLVGNGVEMEGLLHHSSDAYERIYKLISARIMAGEACTITYVTTSGGA
jgi:hypothetical protein